MDFEAMAPGALRALMASALEQAARQGLTGEHHFYITFDTRHEGVVMPDSLRASYPEAMTIVLQHEFSDLEVSDKGFSVSLAFNGVTHNLAAPFDAVIGFADPSINFMIQLKAPQAGVREAPAGLETERDGERLEDKPGDVVTLDSFRKK